MISYSNIFQLGCGYNCAIWQRDGLTVSGTEMAKREDTVDGAKHPREGAAANKNHKKHQHQVNGLSIPIQVSLVLVSIVHCLIYSFVAHK